MEISPGIEIIGTALHFRKEKTLVISDLHLGYEEALHRRGVLVPKFQLEEIIKSLKKILEKVKPKVIVINGDLKHEFGTVLQQEWKDVLFLLDFILSRGIRVVIIQGNHDPLTKTVAEKRGVKVIKEYQLGDALIVHGDEIAKIKLEVKQPEAKQPGAKRPKAKQPGARLEIKRLLIGHVHPAITLREGSKYEKYKCFLKGKWKGKELIVLPSFNPLLEGTDIGKEKSFSPFLGDIDTFKAYIVHGGKVFDFGKLKSILGKSF